MNVFQPHDFPLLWDKIVSKQQEERIMTTLPARSKKYCRAIQCTSVFFILVLSFSSTVFAGVEGKPLHYKSGDTQLYGYIAVDGALSEKRPGVLVVHEWWGHNEYARKRARMLAEIGYVALAVDMYGDGKTADHPDDAGKFAGAVRQNMDIARERFRAALDLLKKHPQIDPSRIGAIGYCFGGGIVLQMARDGMDLKGVASFHGSLATGEPAKAGSIKARILVLTGEEDPMTPPEQIAAFNREMKTAGAISRVIVYPGAEHSFTNPDADRFGEKFDLPLSYNAEADRKSWEEMKDFFQEVFR